MKKLDKSKLFVGKEGTYANITLIETPGGKYGDWMVVDDTTKEEREDNKKSTILGNGKNYGWGESGSSESRSTTPSDELPY